jgi:hypothetical protein
MRITVVSPRYPGICQAGIAHLREQLRKRFSSNLLHTNMPLKNARALLSLCVPKFHGCACEARGDSARLLACRMRSSWGME